jgi:hypothetical protein
MLNLFKWVYRKGETQAAMKILLLVQNTAMKGSIDSPTQVTLFELANTIRSNYFKGEK